MKKTMVLLLVVMLAVIIFFVYKQYLPTSKSAQVPVKTIVSGVLLVATDATYPPLESVDSKGKIVGFDMDMAQELADQLKLKLEVKNIGFDSIFDELTNKKVDLIISSVTITPERLTKYAFSSPYFNAGQVLIVKKDSGFMTTADLRGKKIGAQVDTTSLKEAAKLTDIKMAIPFADYELATKDLLSGKIEAMVIDYPVGVGIVDKNNLFKILGEPFTQEFYGVVLRKEDKELLEAINRGLAAMKQSNKLSSIRKSWKL